MKAARVEVVCQFRCPDCGVVNTVPRVPITGDDAEDAAREFYDLEEWQTPDDEQLEGFVACPETAKCGGCGGRYRMVEV